MLCMYVAVFHCPKVSWVKEVEGASKNKLKDSNDKRHILAYFVGIRKEDIKLLDLKSTSILNISALLLFKNSSAFTYWLVGTVNNVK